MDIDSIINEVNQIFIDVLEDDEIVVKYESTADES